MLKYGVFSLPGIVSISFFTLFGPLIDQNCRENLRHTEDTEPIYTRHHHLVGYFHPPLVHFECME